MNSPSQIRSRCRLAASVAAALAFSWSLQAGAQIAPPPVPAGEQPEVLTRGPVHEAFAEPVILQYQVGLVAPIPPPDNIDEVPPADRPVGDQFAWVPGYWSWDSERRGYIWVSACWRAVPPNMAWVPGYWNRVTSGWEWEPGFWIPAGTKEIQYLPAPPANDDVDAPGAPPIADSSWVPPCWYWSADHYVQRPGYWLASQPDWVWVASHYLWTPRGYVFAGGHWDYPLEDRGVLFAPVYIPPTVYARVGYAYSPTVVIDVDLLSASLFVDPRYSHYYYGDYYDDAYVKSGIFPWFDRDRIPDFYDPIYSYDRSRASRSQPDWDQQVRHDYDARRANTALRPPRTFRDMEARVAQAPEPQRRSLEVVQPLSTVVNSAGNTRPPAVSSIANPVPARTAPPVRFEKVTPAAQTKIATQAADVKKLGNDRKGWEASAVNPKAVQAPSVQPTPVVGSGGSRGPGTASPVDRKPPAGAVPNTPMPLAPPAALPPARNEPVLPPAGRNPTVIPPSTPKEPVVIPAADHKPPAAAVPNPPVLVTPAAHNEPAISSTPRRPAATAPREVPVAQPETVKLAAPPPVADIRPAPAADRGPPPRPANEAHPQLDPKGPPTKDDAPASRPNDPSPGGRGGGNGRGN